jgi:hypothetical protein
MPKVQEQENEAGMGSRKTCTIEVGTTPCSHSNSRLVWRASSGIGIAQSSSAPSTQQGFNSSGGLGAAYGAAPEARRFLAPQSSNLPKGRRPWRAQDLCPSGFGSSLKGTLQKASLKILPMLAYRNRLAARTGRSSRRFRRANGGGLKCCHDDSALANQA